MFSEADTGDGEIQVRCTQCGFVGMIDDFEVMGADPNRLFCLACGREILVEEAVEPVACHPSCEGRGRAIRRPTKRH
jgi:hypothetical protein